MKPLLPKCDKSCTLKVARVVIPQIERQLPGIHKSIPLIEEKYLATPVPLFTDTEDFLGFFSSTSTNEKKPAFLLEDAKIDTQVMEASPVKPIYFATKLARMTLHSTSLFADSDFFKSF
jgi:hypothetical protein